MAGTGEADRHLGFYGSGFTLGATTGGEFRVYRASRRLL